MIEIKTFNKNQLLKFIHSDDFNLMPILPISKHRAISHIHNPRVFDDDILLLIAYEENNMLGYLGVLPDTLQHIHVGWLSCIWVSPLARGNGIAKQMVLTAYEAYQHRILITNYTPEAEKLYHKLGIFEELTILHGVRFYRKMCLGKIVPQRFPRLAKFSLVLKGFDFFANLFVTPILKFTNKKLPDDIQIYKLEKFTEQHQHFIELYQQSFFKRSSIELTWIKDYPWLKQIDKKSNEAIRYHFSSEERKFESTFFEVMCHNERIALIMILYKNGHLRFPYIIYNKVYKTPLEQTLLHIISKYNPYYITLFSDEFNLKVKALYQKPIQRKYMKTRDIDINSIVLYDGDGDAAFT